MGYGRASQICDRQDEKKEESTNLDEAVGIGTVEFRECEEILIGNAMVRFTS